MKISVIVPVYNVRNWVNDCLKSLCGQTFGDWECLCIDDGSEDGSRNEIVEWSKRDRRIRVFQQKHNGVSAARNLGMRHARGEWVTFLDADDLLPMHSFENALRIIERHNPDILRLLLLGCSQTIQFLYLLLIQIFQISIFSLKSGNRRFQITHFSLKSYDLQ